MAIAIQVAMVLASLVLIISVLLQPSETNGMNAMTGGNSETFFGKNKNGSFEGKMALVTKISAAVFVVLALVMIFVQ